MKRRILIGLALLLLAALPLAGGAWRGFPAGFFSFPPLVARQPAHAPFSWPIFVLFAALALLAAGLLLSPPRACLPAGALAKAGPVGESVPA